MAVLSDSAQRAVESTASVRQQVNATVGIENESFLKNDFRFRKNWIYRA